HLGKDVEVKLCAVRARHGGIFDDSKRRIRISERLIPERPRRHQFAHRDSLNKPRLLHCVREMGSREAQSEKGTGNSLEHTIRSQSGMNWAGAPHPASGSKWKRNISARE